MKLVVADIDGVDARRAALDENLGETAGTGADIEDVQPVGPVAEVVQPGDQLQGGTGDVAAGRIERLDRRIDRHHHCRLPGGFTGDDDGAAQNGIARPSPGRHDTALDQHDIETPSLGKTAGRRPRGSSQ